ncbi:MAG: biopolymer transporter ExbD [Kiritimatiellia bacterium]
MMRRRQRRGTPIEAEVSMSPLIDCVFLLLIFFLVATMFKKEKRDIDIVPPESVSASKIRPDDQHLVLSVGRDGALYLQGRETEMNEIFQRLGEQALENPERRIRIDADHRAPLYHVAQLLDMCQFRGLTNVGIRSYDNKYNR